MSGLTSQQPPQAPLDPPGTKSITGTFAQTPAPGVPQEGKAPRSCGLVLATAPMPHSLLCSIPGEHRHQAGCCAHCWEEAGGPRGVAAGTRRPANRAGNGFRFSRGQRHCLSSPRSCRRLPHAPQDGVQAGSPPSPWASQGRGFTPGALQRLPGKPAQPSAGQEAHVPITGHRHGGPLGLRVSRSPSASSGESSLLPRACEDAGARGHPGSPPSQGP